MIKPDFKNKKVLILGLGLLGRGLKDTIYFIKHGAKVTVTDLKTAKQLAPTLKKLKKYPQIKYVLGKHRYQDIDRADLIIRNADVPDNSPFLQYAFEKNKTVEMDEALFARYCPCPIIGITGTRGKTTTSTLIAEILQLTGKRIYLAGNIMNQATLPLLDKITANDLVVLELSSWQLQGFGWNKISPQIAVFTNFYPDHLNRYKSMTAYFNDKTKIFKYQKPTDHLILNKNQKIIRDLSKKAKSQISFFTPTDIPKNWKFKILGSHNMENIAAAMQVGKIFGLSLAKMKKTVEKFPGVEHRLQYITTIKQVDFINDTTSTTPVATIKAIDAIQKPIIIIAGGASKKIDLTPLADKLTTDKKLKAIILLEGSATDELESKIIKAGGNHKIFGRFIDFREAILAAQTIARKNQVILLSPGCASFGMFKNEFDRGNRFIKIVKNLA